MSTPSLLGLIDTHAHLQDPDLRTDLANILERARLAGVVKLIGMGTTAADSAEVVAIADQFPGVFAAVGVQPNYVAEAKLGDWEQIVALAGSPRVVAIGETGLDRYWDHSPFPLQQEWFERHLTLADALDLPVVIHCRDCEQDIIGQLARWNKPTRGVLHSFTGTWEDAQAFMALGLHISFAGMLTFANKKLDVLRGVASRVPVDRLLIETDSPYLSPHPHRGKRNEPSRLAFTAARIAEIRGIPLAELALQTSANACHLFRLPEDKTV